MADPIRDEHGNDGRDLKGALRDRSMEQLEGVKGQFAESAERVAAAVDKTADELEGDGDDAVSGIGHSLASVMRQLAGGLRGRARLARAPQSRRVLGRLRGAGVRRCAVFQGTHPGAPQ